MNKILMIFVCVLFASCGLDRWEALPTDQDNSEVGEGVAMEQTNSESSTVSTPAIQSTEQSESATMGTYPSTGTTSTGGAEDTIEVFDWARVLITEVVTDPQQDFSDSGGGNGILFDAVPGTGTVGTTDEYVEIFNGTSEIIDISQWSLKMIDGTDEEQLLGEALPNAFFSLDGNPQEFGAGEFAVIGNPKGSLNNASTIDLLNELNEIVDEVVIDDANADSVDNEAFTRLPDGTWAMGKGTPGTFE